jgi:simple sugar transport system ATP-binding protein
MNILTGLYHPDAGTIALDGRPVRIGSPRDAIAAGIGMVHQHFALAPSLTVTENILLGLPTPRFRLSLGRLHDEIRDFSERMGLRVEPTARIWQLTVGEQQREEILKALYRGARTLILDEPTAVLGPAETEELFRTLRAMAADGGSIVIISHKLDEVLSVADRITVLRRGKVTAAGIDAAGRTTAELARLMVGRDVLESVERPTVTTGPVVLSLRNVSATNDKGLPALRGIDLEVRAGEIVGIAGVAGNGQSELAEVITGLRSCTGSITVHGRELANRPVLEVIEAGVAHIPEDRNGTGSAPGLSIADNVVLKRYRDAPVGGRIRIGRSAARRIATQLVADYRVATPSIDTPARLLSGGNLQRLILARELTSGPRVIVAVQPTRGLDVGAIEHVHRLLLAQRTTGAAILIVSEDLDELMLLADRIEVLYEGRIAGEVEPSVVREIGEIAELMTSGAAGGEPISAGRVAVTPPVTEDADGPGADADGPGADAAASGGGSRAGLA